MLTGAMLILLALHLPAWGKRTRVCSLAVQLRFKHNIPQLYYKVQQEPKCNILRYFGDLLFKFVSETNKMLGKVLSVDLKH